MHFVQLHKRIFDKVFNSTYGLRSQVDEPIDQPPIALRAAAAAAAAAKAAYLST